MTFSKTFLSLALSAVLFIGCKDTAKSPETTSATDETKVTQAANGKIETASFSIDGMSCAMGCAKTLEKKLAGLEGVQDATVDFDKKVATVKYDTSKQSVQQLAKTVESAADGKTYKVSNVKNSGDKAMFFKDKDKKKKSKRSGEKKECSADEKDSKGKPACCAAKKANQTEEKKTL